MFEIGFTNDKPRRWEMTDQQKMSFIRIGDFIESTVTPLDLWSEEEYIRHWQESLARIVDKGFRSTALIVSFELPPVSGQLFWWVLYREGDIVYVHNQMIRFSRLRTPFDPCDPYHSISRRKTKTANGLRVSEWSLSMNELRQYKVTRST